MSAVSQLASYGEGSVEQATVSQESYGEGSAGQESVERALLKGHLPHAAPALADLEPYDPRYLPARVYLNANENPYGMPSAVRKALASAIDGASSGTMGGINGGAVCSPTAGATSGPFADTVSPANAEVAAEVYADTAAFSSPLYRYPSPLADRLRSAIASAQGVAPSCVLVGNGGDELLFNLMLAYGGAGRLVLITPPTFSVYATNALLTGTRVLEVPRSANGQAKAVTSGSAEVTGEGPAASDAASVTLPASDIASAAALDTAHVDAALAAAPGSAPALNAVPALNAAPAAAPHTVGLDLRVNEQAVLDALTHEKPDLVFLTSPNNPTGECLSLAFIEQVCLQTTALVCVDHAYIEFASPGFNATALLARFENLAVLRTFSKAYGLAGLRVGYVLASLPVIRELLKVRQPYSVNTLSACAALAALQATEEVQASVALIVAERERLSHVLTADLGLQVAPSEANFLLVRLPASFEASVVWQRLYQEYGILVRDLSASPGLTNCLRITVGTPEENNELLAALQQILKQVLKQILGQTSKEYT